MKPKNTIILLAATIAIALSACSKESAIDQIMRDPHMRENLIQRMIQLTPVKNDLTDDLLADTAWVKVMADQLAELASEREREIVLERLLVSEKVREMVLNKLAEDPVMKRRMKEISK